MTNPQSRRTFAFYGRTRRATPARSVEAIQERVRQLSNATEPINAVNGTIALMFFDTSSDPLAAWRHRQQARRPPERAG
jgi:hypothetical protein